MILFGLLFFFFKEFSILAGENINDVSCYNDEDNGVTYLGSATTAISIQDGKNKTCKNWKIYHSNYTSFYPDHKYCRNPKPYEISKPWCYTGPGHEYGLCNISVCGKFCPDLPSYLLTSDKKSKYQYGELAIVVSCVPGYNNLTQKKYLNCTSSAKWNDTVPSCIANNCKSLDLGPHVKSSHKMPKFNDLVTLSCEEGYFAASINIKCYANGSWPSVRPNCSPLPCPIIKLPVHSFDKDMKESTMYYFDQIVDFKCEHGYNLIGNGTNKCTFKRSSKVVDWNYDDKQICLGVLCPLPNITDNLVLITNKTEFRFGDQTLFDCVGDFELTSQLSATRECVVDENSNENGKWTGETPICQVKAAAKHSGALGPAIGGGIGAAVIVIVVAVVIVFIIRRRKVSQKNKNEMQHNESTLELNNSNIYSQVAERVDSHVYGKTRVHHVYYNVHDTTEAEKEQDPAKFKLDERYDVSSMMKRIKTREVLKEEFSVLSTCYCDSRTTCRDKTSSTGTKTDVEQSCENTVATAKYSDEISILFEAPLNHMSESFWSMVDDRHVETIIFLVKDNELVTEFYPKLDDIFKMKTLEIDLNSSEKPSKNILFLTFNILNKARQTTRQVKMYKTSAWKDSDQYPSVETLCYLLDKTSERNKRPIMIIGSKTSGLPIGGVLSVCLNVLEAIRNDRPFNVLDCAITVKKRSSSFFQNCEIYGLCYKVIENHLDSVNTYDIIS